MNLDHAKPVFDLGPRQLTVGRRMLPLRKAAGLAGGASTLVRIAMGWAAALALSLASQGAQAQSNLDAGKSPAQIFADTCSACHKSPREIKRTSAAFMREHYTTGMKEATAMAAYLASVGSDARAIQQRKPPVLGAGQASPNENGRSSTPSQQGGDQAKPENQAALPGAASGTPTEPAKPRSRRPSESVEIGTSSGAETAAGLDAAASHAAAGGATRPNSAEEFEE
jgi:hypothetical protein